MINVESPNKSILNVQTQDVNQSIANQRFENRMQKVDKRVNDIQDKVNESPLIQSQLAIQKKVSKSLGSDPLKSNAVVQRAVGFEFETNAVLRGGSMNYKSPIYDKGWDGKKVEAYGSGWNAHVDGGTVEFVTQPTEKKDELNSQIDSLVGAAEKMESALMKTDGSKEIDLGNTFSAGGQSYNRTASTKARNRDLYPAGITADVQNSYSLPLDRVSKFYASANKSAKIGTEIDPSRNIFRPRSAMGHAKMTFPDASVIAHQHWSKMVKKVINSDQDKRDVASGNWDNLKDISWYLQFEGVATIIVDYLNSFMVSINAASKPKYVKSEFPVMHRVSFTNMIKSMGAGQNLADAEFGELVLSWANEMVKINNVNQDSPQVLKSLQSSLEAFDGDKDLNKFLKSIKTVQKGEHMQKETPNVHDWLQSMQGDHPDDLSFGNKNNDLDSSSMGTLTMDNIDKDSSPKAIIENRGLTLKAKVHEWKGIAKAIFDDYEKRK